MLALTRSRSLRLGVVAAQGTREEDNGTYRTSFILTDFRRQVACSNCQSVVCVEVGLDLLVVEAYRSFQG